MEEKRERGGDEITGKLSDLQNLRSSYSRWKGEVQEII
jgi:hypothetical protein